MKDGRYLESVLRREGLRKADIEVALRQQNNPEAMTARRDGVDVLRRRVDELEQRLSDKLDLLHNRQAPALSRGARPGTPRAAAPSPVVTPPRPAGGR